MRIYRLNTGVEHLIFIDNLEAISYLCNEKYQHLNVNLQDLSEQDCAFPVWDDPCVNNGDWVRSDDGRVLQVLAKTKLVTYRGKGVDRYIATYGDGGAFVRWLIRVAFGGYMWFNKSSGERVTYRRMIADSSTIEDRPANDQSGIKRRRWVLGKYMTDDKRIFAYWMAVTLDPIQAFVKTKAGGNRAKHWRGKKTLVYMAFELAKDPYVIEEMSTYKNMSSIREQIKAKLSSEGLDVDFAIKQLKAGIDANSADIDIYNSAGELTKTVKNPKAGGKNHREWTELLLKVIEYSENESPTASLNGKLNKPASLEGSQSKENQLDLPEPRKEIADSVKADKQEDVIKVKPNMVLVTPSSPKNS